MESIKQFAILALFCTCFYFWARISKEIVGLTPKPIPKKIAVIYIGCLTGMLVGILVLVLVFLK